MSYRYLSLLLIGCLVASGCGQQISELAPKEASQPPVDMGPMEGSSPGGDSMAMYPPEVRKAMENAAAGKADTSSSASRSEPTPEPSSSGLAGSAEGDEKAGGFDGPADRFESKSKAPEAEASRLEHTESERRQMRAGLLTAGSFDDHARFADFKDFLSSSLQSDPSESLPRMAIGHRVIIHVHNGQGEPIGNAKVSIHPKSSQGNTVLHATRTGSDGRALFLTATDAPTGGQEFLVKVEAPGVKPIEKVLSSDDPFWRIEASTAEMDRPQRLDLALVIDATGSMGDELNYLKIEIDHIATTVKKMFPNVDQRFALIVYRDAGDEYVTRTFDFTSSLSNFRNTLAKQRANGGGDYPEAMHVAMDGASQLSWRDGNAARVMFLIGDAPPHDRYAQQTMQSVAKLREQNVRVFPIAASGAAEKAEFILRSTAFLTMGQYLFLTDHSGVGNPHATPHVPDYQVEHLNRLMVRMVAQELAGKKLAPQEVLAIERGDSAPLQFQPIDPLAQTNPQVFYDPTPRVQINHVTHPVQPITVDLDVHPKTFRWVVYALAICGVIFLGSLAARNA